MTILHISDTHNKHRELRELPSADIIIHSGDMALAGSEDEIMDFIEWFIALPYQYKIFIAGNHDNFLFQAKIDGLPKNCFYLCNSEVIIEGVKFYGIPLFMEDVILGNCDKQIQEIPNDTDVLITHQPPYSILDFSVNINYGDPYLLKKVLQIQPKLHLFGHIHNAYGMKKNDDTLFVNATILDEYYDVANTAVLLRI